MSDHEYDFTVIGGGSAGYAAARTAAALGMKTALVDGSVELGGLCILRGCMPSKALIESANRALSLQRAAEFGLTAQHGTPNLQAIRDRKRALINDFASYRQRQLENGRFELLRAHGTFAGAHSLSLQPTDGGSKRTIASRYFCVATGSESNVPPIPGLVETGFWTSDDVLDTDRLPESCIVLGGGAIALEMAHYMSSLGTQVTLIQRNRQLLTGVDPEAGEIIVKAYRHRGMAVYCGTKIHRVEGDGRQKSVLFATSDGGDHRVAAEQILVALGRHPASDGLGLELAGVSRHGKKIITNAALQTSKPHIFAAGDVSSPLDVVHLAIQQGELAARNAARLHSSDGAPFEQIDYRLRLFGVFSHPQVAAVGASEEELRKAGTPYQAASYPFDDHGKSMVMGETEGIVKLLADAQTGEILGALCIGPEATELIHEIVVAMHHRCTAATLASIPHYHPTLSEIWTYPAEELAERTTRSMSQK